MLRTVSTRCRPKPNSCTQLTAKRFRSSNPSPKRTSAPGPPSWTKRLRRPQFALPRTNSPFNELSPHEVKGAPPEDLITEAQCIEYFVAQVRPWATNNRTFMRLARFGYTAVDIQPFLDAFVSTAESGFFNTPDNFTRYQLSRFAHDHSSSPKAHLRLAEAEVTFSNIFFSWIASTFDSGVVLAALVSSGKAKLSVLDNLRHLAVASERRPAEEFPWARKFKRKIIMHVGPTNSGKTHHALRALAAAKSGVYAGPLRLLAHEIWERLNLGQIVPLDVEQPLPNVNGHPSSSPTNPSPTSSSFTTSSQFPSSSTPSSLSPSSSSSAELNSIAPEAKKLNSNPLYARATNMLTGEERKIVDESAPLLSCTVEMLSFRVCYEVGVIDEIQMIGDSQRGYAWTEAVLGLCAKELHLCGEESAIPVIKELLKETNDELIVRRYERLTPLNVEEQSLDGDFGKVKKGDCIVAFSRQRIFEIKDEVEKLSGLRCAVVYGKLPPEIRSEQAALFNDPTSGFDVIIGSDAIGMGLNLKIRRIIFDATSKSDGRGRLLSLTTSQVKQIAGRAGRYGHSLSGDTPGGYATTLYDKDLAVLRNALEKPSTPPLKHAYICPTPASFISVASALMEPLPSSTSSPSPFPSTSSPPSPSPSLPSLDASPSTPQHPNISFETTQMAHLYTYLPPSPTYKYTQSPRLSEICSWIDDKAKGVLTWQDKLLIYNCPVSWREKIVVDAAEEMVKLQRDEMCVEITSVLGVEEGSFGQREGEGRSIGRGEGKDGVWRDRAWSERRGKGMGTFAGLVRRLEEVEEKMRIVKSIMPEVGVEGKSGTDVGAATAVDDFRRTSPPSRDYFKHKQRQPLILAEHLDELESLHKVLVLYMWMHFRNSVVYPDREITEQLKLRVEVALDWGLQEVGKGRYKDKEKELIGAAEETLDHGTLGGHRKMAPFGPMGGARQGKSPFDEWLSARFMEADRDVGFEGMTSALRKIHRERGRGSREGPAPLPFKGSKTFTPMPKNTPSVLSRRQQPTGLAHSTNMDSEPIPPPTPTPTPTPTSTPRPRLISSYQERTRLIMDQSVGRGPSQGGGGFVADAMMTMSKKPWDRPPDLSALLRKYVDNPSLKVGKSDVRK